jgi:hypothetical protein
MTPRQSELYSGMFGRLPLMMRWKMRWNYPLSDDELVRARSFLTGPRQVALSDLPYRSDGDPHRAFLNSGKLTKAFDLLKDKLDADPRHKAIVYSNFPEAGLRPYAAALAKAGIPHGIFDGKLSDPERKSLVEGFTKGRVRVALVGPAGAEGISLKGAQLMQVLDGSWQDARTRQAIGRGLSAPAGTVVVHASGKYVGRIVPEPFLRPAWDAKAETALKALGEILWTEITKTVARVAAKGAK